MVCIDEKKSFVPSFLLVFCVSVIYAFLAYYMPLYADDFVFNVDTFDVFITKAFTMYFTWGGRVATYIYFALIKYLPKEVYALVILIIVSITLYSIARISSSKEKYISLKTILFVCALFWFSVPYAWESILWRSGSFYSLNIALACLLMIPLARLFADTQYALKKYHTYFFMLIAFIIPFISENVPLGLFPFYFAYVYIAKKNSQKIPFFVYATFVSLLIASMFSFFAPGNFARAVASSVDAKPFLYILSNFLYKIFISVAFPLMTSLIILMLFFFHKRSLFYPYCKMFFLFLFSALFSSSITIISGTISYRTLGFATVLMIVYSAIIFNELRKTHRRISAVISSILLIFLTFSLYTTLKDYRLIAQDVDNRGHLLQDFVNNNVFEAFIPELRTSSNRNFAFIDSLRGNPIPWLNTQIAHYYNMQTLFILMDNDPANLVAQSDCKDVPDTEGRLNSLLTIEKICIKQYMRTDNTRPVFSLIVNTEENEPAFDEIVFLGIDEQSHYMKKILYHLIRFFDTQGLGVKSFEKYLYEIFERTVLVPRPNTFYTESGKALYYISATPTDFLGVTPKILGCRVKYKNKYIFLKLANEREII